MLAVTEYKGFYQDIPYKEEMTMAMASMKKGESMMYAEESYSGLTLCLDGDQTKALGLDTLPEPGKEVMIKAKAVVKRTVIENDGEGKENYLTIEITEMEIGKFSGGAVDVGSMLYGSDD